MNEDTIDNSVLCIGLVMIFVSWGMVYYNNYEKTEKDKEIVSYGINGFTETRCISGYKFVLTSKEFPTQIFDSQGHGIPCRN